LAVGFGCTAGGGGAGCGFDRAAASRLIDNWMISFTDSGCGAAGVSHDGQWWRIPCYEDAEWDKNESGFGWWSTHCGDPLPLTAEGRYFRHPLWSPDGKYLAFLSFAKMEARAKFGCLTVLAGEAFKLRMSPGVNEFRVLRRQLATCSRIQSPKRKRRKLRSNDKPAPQNRKNAASRTDNRLHFKEGFKRSVYLE